MTIRKTHRFISDSKDKQNKAMTPQEVETYGAELQKVLVGNGILSCLDHMIISGFIYARMVYNTQFLFSNKIAVADSLIFASFINSIKITDGIHYKELVQKYSKMIFEKTKKLLVAVYDTNDTYTSELCANRISFFQQVINESVENIQKGLESLSKEFEFILAQDYCEKKYLPFKKDSPLYLVSIFDLTRCEQEVNHFLHQFDSLFGEDISQFSDYLKETQESWDEFNCDD